MFSIDIASCFDVLDLNWAANDLASRTYARQYQTSKQRTAVQESSQELDQPEEHKPTSINIVIK